MDVSALLSDGKTVDRHTQSSLRLVCIQLLMCASCMDKRERIPIAPVQVVCWLYSSKVQKDFYTRIPISETVQTRQGLERCRQCYQRRQWKSTRFYRPLQVLSQFHCTSPFINYKCTAVIFRFKVIGGQHSRYSRSQRFIIWRAALRLNIQDWIQTYSNLSAYSGLEKEKRRD